jgi:hypothetical protein
MTEFFAASCGQKAFQETLKSQTGNVIGNTSRGIFIKTRSNRIVFLSSERFLNPLNINLFPFPVLFHQVLLNEIVHLGDSSILFPSRELRIRVHSEKVQSVAAKPSRLLSFGRPEKVVGHIIREILKKTEPSIYTSTLLHLLSGNPGSQVDSFTQRFLAISQASSIPNIDQIISTFDEFIGQGHGLTPSGDDLVCGYLLAMNRWNPHSWSTNFLEQLNAGIISIAWQKTTTLAANLIEIAAEGEADERLITALDSIFTRNPTPEKTAELLISYGSSSGMDAFCGMAISIKKKGRAVNLHAQSALPKN